MKIEHVAFNVADPEAVSSWYVEHLSLKLICHKPDANQTHFLSDEGGGVIEIYCNPVDEVPNYKEQNPLIFHLAVESPDPTTDSKRLIDVGAEFVEEIFTDDGSHLIMLRDPWGLPLQLCRRRASFFK